jgi:hypothetical protein
MNLDTPGPVTAIELVLISEEKHWHFADRSSRELAVDVLSALRLGGYLREGM